MTMAFPLAISASVIGIIGLLFFALGGDISGQLKSFGRNFQDRIDRADMTIKAEEFALIVFGAGLIVWFAVVLLVRPANIFIGALILPLAVSVSSLAGTLYLKIRGDIRVNTFVQQLELVLRLLSGALRVGLGLRQSIILVTEEVPDPARREFMRVIGRTNIGIGMLDALDELSTSMPSHEMRMFARSVRVQAQTGGDLAKVLETLASTIRDRRRVFRKMKALTAQGRFGAFIIGGLPVLVGGFVVFTQPELGHALLHTTIGYITLGIAGGLELLAIFALMKILEFDA